MNTGFMIFLVFMAFLVVLTACAEPGSIEHQNSVSFSKTVSYCGDSLTICDGQVLISHQYRESFIETVLPDGTYGNDNCQYQVKNGTVEMAQ